MPTLRLWKPYGVLSQFTPQDGHQSLADFVQTKGVYPVGRLDHDSEGLLILTDSGYINSRLTQPKFVHPKTYLVQVEGTATLDAMNALKSGVTLNDGLTKPALCELLKDSPVLPDRIPPVPDRGKETSWLRLTITEGRNRQVRRMTASVGLPTLRLVRWSIGKLTLEGLSPGEVQEVSPEESRLLFSNKVIGLE